MLRQLVFGLVVLVLGSAVLVSSGVAARELQLAPLAAVSDHPVEGRSIGEMTYMGMSDPRYEEAIRSYLAEHGVDHPRPLALDGRSAFDAAREMLNVELRNGRTIAQWVELAKADNLLSLQPQAEVEGDLVKDTARLARAAGLSFTAADRISVQKQAAVLPVELRAPFADLVHVVANVYEAQLPIAARMDAKLATATDAMHLVMGAEDREATLAGALAIVAAENAFRAAVGKIDITTVAAAPIFADPAGLVILGSEANDVYGRTGVLQDPILLVDLGGDDTYFTSAAGACPDVADLIADCNGLVVSTLLDLAGNDVYSFDGQDSFTQGAAGMGAIGVLVDVDGNDQYLSKFARSDSGRGPVFMYINGGTQGYALAGVGLLVDGLGDDVYRQDVQARTRDIWGFSQGFGNAGGLGISADGAGDDEWLAYGNDIGMTGCCFQGLYPGGTGFYTGLGIMSDTGSGADRYHAWDEATTTDFYAYGFAAFGGTGIFFEDGGNDDYYAGESASNPFINPLLNCAYGTASFAGLGVFLEMGGHDTYFGDTRSPRNAATMNEGFGGPAEGEGVFLDVSGDDGHFMEAHSGAARTLNYDMTHGRGLALGGGEGATGNTFGLFLDLGGADAYTGARPSQDNAAWPTGADINAGRIPGLFVGNEP